jgi:hypothetical protein
LSRWYSLDIIYYQSKLGVERDMSQFKAFDNQVEVSGAGMVVLLNSISWSKTSFLEIFGRHGIPDPQVSAWYPQQIALDIYQEIAATMGSHTLYQIGTKVSELSVLPPQIDSLEKGLAAIDIGYHLMHRGGEIGSYQLVKVEHNQAVMVCHNPYPCDFDRGAIIATARKFAVNGAAVSLRHADESSAGCRKLGAESCTYIIEWIAFSKPAKTG